MTPKYMLIFAILNKSNVRMDICIAYEIKNPPFTNIYDTMKYWENLYV